ncbi:MAG TPA: helix-turn-helix transcriptional regulator [Bacillota bacterium]|nr:helix-turn-helix transcriptional regulator [Bacillota bacterium]HPE38253.1 helix-turn-helix transcriptional regulator [Bacillota bacterium]
MILAEKIMNERKKNGWSQEELAEKLNVSRQAVSKWEGAQAVPDLQRVLEMSKLFGVSTDFLLKDEEEAPSYASGIDGISEKQRHVSLEEASEYIRTYRKTSWYFALATMLCILSPITLIVLGGASEDFPNRVSESMAAGIGLVVLFVFVAIAVGIFITNGLKLSKYEYMEKEAFDTEYGVAGMIKEKMNAFEGTYIRKITMGIILCICGVIPLFVGGALDFSDFLLTVMLGALLAIVSVGVYLIVSVGCYKSAMKKILQQDEFAPEAKKSKLIDTVSGVYWTLMVAVYLGYSFITNDWERSWIIWPVAGVAFAAVATICEAIESKKA